MFKPLVEAFFDPDTFTYSYFVSDPFSRSCAIIDSVLDFDPASGNTSTATADILIAAIKRQQLKVEWILETHLHADHLSAAPYLQSKLGGKTAVGAHITEVQQVFGKVFNAGTEFAKDGSQFDQLFKDGDTFKLGQQTIEVIHTLATHLLV